MSTGTLFSFSKNRPRLMLSIAHNLALWLVLGLGAIAVSSGVRGIVVGADLRAARREPSFQPGTGRLGDPALPTPPSTNSVRSREVYLDASWLLSRRHQSAPLLNM